MTKNGLQIPANTNKIFPYFLWGVLKMRCGPQTLGKYNGRHDGNFFDLIGQECCEFRQVQPFNQERFGQVQPFNPLEKKSWNQFFFWNVSQFCTNAITAGTIIELVSIIFLFYYLNERKANGNFKRIASNKTQIIRWIGFS